jgi:hypothetical protein
LSYGYYFFGCIVLLAIETAVWKKFVGAPFCGQYCNLKYEIFNVPVNFHNF